MSAKIEKRSANGQGLRLALLALTGAGATATLATGVEAQTATVQSTTVPAPVTARIRPPRTWHRVKIALTADQQAQLAKLGVSTSTLDITTYRISQLGGKLVN